MYSENPDDVLNCFDTDDAKEKSAKIDTLMFALATDNEKDKQANLSNFEKMYEKFVNKLDYRALFKELDNIKDSDINELNMQDSLSISDLNNFFEVHKELGRFKIKAIRKRILSLYGKNSISDHHYIETIKKLFR